MGKYMYPDGKIYEGHWAIGKRHGRGILKDITGEQIVGEWSNGNYAGKLR